LVRDETVSSQVERAQVAAATNGECDDERHSFEEERRSMAAERRSAEISAAVRSLHTNLFLCVTFVFAYSMFAFLPDMAIVVIVSVMKGVTPIVTALVNFGKIQTVVKLYWERAVQDFKKNVS
jgi:hypothetical protein